MLGLGNLIQRDNALGDQDVGEVSFALAADFGMRIQALLDPGGGGGGDGVKVICEKTPEHITSLPLLSSLNQAQKEKQPAISAIAAAM